MSTLAPGSRLGVYEIHSALGAGGMGEVYRARDTKLGRAVAIKVLPEHFVSDRERVARFEREAQLLASLNHPHIAAIHGFEEAGGAHFLILELVDGETLADCLARGPLPLPEALDIARQIGEALQAAHDRGIVHRDLKPANVALTADGQVKVLDFGLAKAMTRDADADAANSPTLTLGATAAGVVLGTAAYMSPEQAKGRTADKRSDVWGFGCVLYEMLTGTRAFEGEDVSETLANVLKSEPDWSALPAGVPAPILALLERSIVKDRTKRIGDMSTALFLIDEHASVSSAVGGPPPAPATRHEPWRRGLPWAVALIAVVCLAATLMLWSPWRTTTAPLVRLSAELGVDASFWTSNSGSAAILSPDGRMLAFVAQAGDAPPQLYVRRLDELRPTLLPGTDEASSPFFSPDGAWIAFFAGGKLKKASVSGGGTLTICDVPSGRGGDWGDDGMIVYSPAPAPGTALWRVSAEGGTPEPFSRLEGGELTHRYPTVLPGARAVVFMAHDATGAYDGASIVVQSIPSGDRKVLVRGGFYPRFARSGHLLFIQQGSIMAAPFDVGRLELTGSPVPVVPQVSAGAGGGAQYAVSRDGTLVYVTGSAFFGANELPMHWLTRQGKTEPLRPAPANWANPMFSPDGQRLAIDLVTEGRLADVYVYEPARDTLTRITFGAFSDMMPLWTIDGRRLAYAGNVAGQPMANLFWQSADGSGEPERLTPPTPNPQLPTSWHPSGRYLLFAENRRETNFDLMILPFEGDAKTGWKPGSPTVLLSTPFLEQNGVFSPDGRWVAYESNEGGANEIYVRPFPGPGGKWQISTGGGMSPTWSRARNELLYQSPNTRQVMAVAYTTDGESFRADRQRVWADARIASRPRNVTSRAFALHPDGERAVVASAGDASTRADKVVIVFNFFDELRRLASRR